MLNMLRRDLEALKEKQGSTHYITLGENTVVICYCRWFYKGKQRMGWMSHKIGKDKNLFDVQLDFVVEHVYKGLVS